MSVTFPKGFRAAGMTAGLKPSGRPDLALLVSDEPAVVAGLFTTNAYPAAPVKLSRARLSAAGDKSEFRAVLVNSGDANAGRGEQGDADAVATSGAAASTLGLQHQQVLACSTGVIGGGFDVERIAGATGDLAAGLSDDDGGGRAFAEAISTTDTVIKEAKAEVGPYRLGACAKGAAMVEPRLDLATMLVFFTTDAPVSAAAARELAHGSLKPAFEQLTIDGCTSTNDTVLLFANGAAGGDPIQRGSAVWDGLALALREMGDSLAYQLAADAEGGTKVLLIDVEGAQADDDARQIAKALANSVLVKTAAFGGDPNPGRFVQALGSSGARFDAATAQIMLGDVLVADAGSVLADYDEGGRAHQLMKEDEIRITIRVGDGPASARAIGCDLSYEYVKINAEYTT